jgi:hypothetical protein
MAGVGQKLGARHKCDTCIFFPQTKCEVNDNKVCEPTLALFGRPVISWTPGIPGSGNNTFEKLEAANDTAGLLKRTALIALPGLRGQAESDTILMVDPVVLAVDQGDEPSGMDEFELDDAERALSEQYEVWEGH